MGQGTSCYFLVLSGFLPLFLLSMAVDGTEFTLVNNCNHSIWPAILANPGNSRPEQTGFELPSDTSRLLYVPNRWVGQIWARNRCYFNKSGFGSCTTGNCASGKIECDGAVGLSPMTLVEFNLGSGAHDSYNVNLIYGFNLPVIVVPLSGTGTCESAGCMTDLNLLCPVELRAANGLACRSGCMTFGTPDHCCRGAFGSRYACKPSNYSVIFKSACPRSLIAGYVDSRSAFTCKGANYKITFCPSKKYAKKITSTAVITTEEPEETGAGTIRSGSKLEVNGSESKPAPRG